METNKNITILGKIEYPSIPDNLTIWIEGSMDGERLSSFDIPTCKITSDAASNLANYYRSEIFKKIGQIDPLTQFIVNEATQIPFTVGCDEEYKRGYEDATKKILNRIVKLLEL